MTSEKMKRFQANVSMMRWFDAQGGHLETKGISAAGEVIEVPLHRHYVTLNIFRVDVGLKYQLNSQWRLEANVPYETKVQEASIEAVGTDISDIERAAILRNRDNHHRNETYTGPTDSDVLLGYRATRILTDSDSLIGRIGTTIPLGKTEEDPWELGDAGLKHLHIQFGTGTFNPVADLHYSLPLYKGFGASASVNGKFPLYENSKTYRGSRAITYTAGLNYRFSDWLSFQMGYLGSYQTYAYWDGEPDINTGLRFSMLSFNASVITSYNLPLSIALMLPLNQETFYDDTNVLDGDGYEEADAFEFGPLVSLTISYAF